MIDNYDENHRADGQEAKPAKDPAGQDDELFDLPGFRDVDRQVKADDDAPVDAGFNDLIASDQRADAGQAQPTSGAGDDEKKPTAAYAEPVGKVKDMATKSTTTHYSGTHLRKVRRKRKGPAQQGRYDENLGFNWFFWISFVIIAIPVTVFIYLLVVASKRTGTPILGNRLINDLQGYESGDTSYVISSEQVATVKSDIAALSGVQDESVTLTVETLRIYVDAEDALTGAQIKELTESVYQAVVAKLPVDTYFSQHGDYKQYDIEIDVYNDAKADTATYICYELTKNSSMDAYVINASTTAKNAELADNLHNPSTDTGGGTGTDDGDGAAVTSDGE